MTVASAPAVTPERIQQFAWGYVPRSLSRPRFEIVLSMKGPKSCE
jgi:hypothetical protein